MCTCVKLCVCVCVCRVYVCVFVCVSTRACTRERERNRTRLMETIVHACTPLIKQSKYLKCTCLLYLQWIMAEIIISDHRKGERPNAKTGGGGGGGRWGAIGHFKNWVAVVRTDWGRARLPVAASFFFNAPDHAVTGDTSFVRPHRPPHALLKYP